MTVRHAFVAETVIHLPKSILDLPDPRRFVVSRHRAHDSRVLQQDYPRVATRSDAPEFRQRRRDPGTARSRISCWCSYSPAIFPRSNMGRGYCEGRLTVRSTRMHVETAAIGAMQRSEVIPLRIANGVDRRVRKRIEFNSAGAQPQPWG